MTDSAGSVLVRFAPMIYGPTVLFGIGEGAIIPLIPVVADRLGADLALSGLIASALVIGQLCGNMPAGWLVSRTSERITMASAGTVALLGAVALAFAPNLIVLTAAVFVIGLCAAAFGLARHAFMTTKAPLGFRARALSLLGGSYRLGMFVGPFIAAILLSFFGSESSAAWCFAICLIACVLLVLLGPDPEKAVEVSEASAASAELTRDQLMQIVESSDTGRPVTGSIRLPQATTAGERPAPGRRKRGADRRAKDERAATRKCSPEGRGASTGAAASGGAPDPAHEGIFRTMVRFRAVLARLGLAAASLSAVRSARQVALPLWGLSIGIEAHTISLVVGVAGAIDFALFYASGQVMDRFGRLWAVLPAMLLIGSGFLLLAFTHDLGDAAMWYAMLSAVIGVGNGLSSGILMTLGADVAPQHHPAPFLSSWRTLNDAGGALAPVIFSGLAAATTIGVATGAMGVIALVGAAGFWRWVPRFVHRPARTVS